MKKHQKTITIYDLRDNFFVEVHPAGDTSDFYIGHAEYGVKLLMFSIEAPDEASVDQLIESNADEYIAIYTDDFIDSSEEE